MCGEGAPRRWGGLSSLGIEALLPVRCALALVMITALRMCLNCSMDECSDKGDEWLGPSPIIVAYLLGGAAGGVVPLLLLIS